MRLFVALAVLAVLALFGATSCVIRDVDFGQKRCPCDVGYWCDVPEDRCVLGDPPDGSVRDDARPDGAPSDRGPGTDADPPGVFVVADLRAEWVTPNGIRWVWVPMGAEGDLAYYELHVGFTEDLGGATVWTVADNPELGRYRLPRTGVGDVVTGTITGGLEPDTFYYARLVAVDTGSGRTRTNVAVGHTDVAPTDSVVLFDDAPAGGGYPLPDCFQPTDAGEHAAGSAHMEWSVQCTDGIAACTPGTGGQCWENLRRTGLTIDLGGLGMGDFLSAYLELAIAYEGAVAAWYSEISLTMDGVEHQFFPATHAPDGEYRTIQIPLDALRQRAPGGAPTMHADLGNIETWRIGAGWAHGGSVRVDEMRIRW